MFWFEAMKVGIVMAALFAVYNQYLQARKKLHHRAPGAWVHYGLCLMMLYWTAYYIRSIADFPVFEAHQIYVRAPLMLIIMLIGAAGAYGSRRFK